MSSSTTPSQSNNAPSRRDDALLTPIRRSQLPTKTWSGSLSNSKSQKRTRFGFDMGPDREINDDADDMFTQPSKFRPITPKTPIVASQSGNTITSTISHLSSKLKQGSSKTSFVFRSPGPETPVLESRGYAFTPRAVKREPNVIATDVDLRKSPSPRKSLSYRVKGGLSNIVQTLTMELEQDLNSTSQKKPPLSDVAYKVISISRWNRFALVVELQGHTEFSKVLLIDHTVTRAESFISRSPCRLRIGEMYVAEPLPTYFHWSIENNTRDSDSSTQSLEYPNTTDPNPVPI